MQEENKLVLKKIGLWICAILLMALIVVLAIAVYDLIKYDQDVRTLIKEKNATCETVKDRFGLPIVKICNYQEITGCTRNGEPINCSEINWSEVNQ